MVINYKLTIIWLYTNCKILVISKSHFALRVPVNTDKYDIQPIILCPSEDILGSSELAASTIKSDNLH